MEWYWQLSRFVGSEQVKMMSWIWIIIPGGPKDQVTWEMKVGCCQGQLLFYLSSFWLQTVIQPLEVEHSFHCQQMARKDVSWTVGWCHDRIVTYRVSWSWCRLHASTLQNFGHRHFFDVNRISIVISGERDVETGGNMWKVLKMKAWAYRIGLNSSGWNIKKYINLLKCS